MTAGRVCAFCGYDLERLKGSKDLLCPECGKSQTNLPPPKYTTSVRFALKGMCLPCAIASALVLMWCGVAAYFGIGVLGHKELFETGCRWLMIATGAIGLASPVVHAVRLDRERPRPGLEWLTMHLLLGVVFNAIVWVSVGIVGLVLLMSGGYADFTIAG